MSSVAPADGTAAWHWPTIGKAANNRPQGD